MEEFKFKLHELTKNESLQLYMFTPKLINLHVESFESEVQKLVSVQVWSTVRGNWWQGMPGILTTQVTFSNLGFALEASGGKVCPVLLLVLNSVFIS